MPDSEELDMRRTPETLPTRERGDAVWNTSRLAAYLVRTGLMQSSAGQFMPRRSLVGVKGPSPAPTEDMWPFLSGEL